MLRRKKEESDALAVANLAHRVAVLLQAGISPDRTWGYLGQIDEPVAAAIDTRLQQGMSAPQAILAAGEPWKPIAQAWLIATSVGAPMSTTLRSIASAVRDGAETADDVRVALTEPQNTARIMLLLPLFGLVLGIALGFDTLTLLVQHPLGTACLVGGVGLLLIARVWSKRLVRRALDGPRSPGLRDELIAIALSGGVSVPRAIALTDDAGVVADDAAATQRVLELSRLAGVPAADLLRASASDARRKAKTDAKVRAARLSSALLLPLGVCTLPSFFLLGVAPLVLSVITSTEVTW